MATVTITDLQLARIINAGKTFPEVLETGLQIAESQLSKVIERELAERINSQLEMLEEQTFSVEYTRGRMLITYSGKVELELIPIAVDRDQPPESRIASVTIYETEFCASDIFMRETLPIVVDDSRVRNELCGAILCQQTVLLIQ